MKGIINFSKLASGSLFLSLYLLAYPSLAQDIHRKDGKHHNARLWQDGLTANGLIAVKDSSITSEKHFGGPDTYQLDRRTILNTDLPDNVEGYLNYVWSKSKQNWVLSSRDELVKDDAENTEKNTFYRLNQDSDEWWIVFEM